MSGRERRKAKRYVIDGLMVELNGVVHETFDVSHGAVAVLRKAGVDYSECAGPSMFRSERNSALNQPIARLHYINQRAGFVAMGYEVAVADWESTLAKYDVRADVVQLEDVFG